MKRRLTLVFVLLGIAGAILYLEKPRWLQERLGGEEEALGPLPNPSGEDVGLSVGQAAPDFALETLDGRVIRLSDFRGKKVVLVNFWASWCAPCKVEMPDLEEVYREHRDELVVLGVDLQESPEDIKRFLAAVRVSYPILLDREGKVAAAYNKFTQPTSFLVDRAGIIRARKFGAYVREELFAQVEAVLAGPEAETRAPPAPTAVAAAPRPEAMADVRYAELKEKYFGPGEIRQLGLEIDLKRVPYRADVKLDRLLLGCPVVDCIPSIDAPRFVTPAQVTWLLEDDQVIGLSYRGVTKAYPIKILNWHEIVNDVFDGVPVVVSYCPLCNAAVAFRAPEIRGRPARFGVSGRLYNSDLVLYDRVSYSLWSQIEGRVIVGPLAGRSPRLERLAVDLSSWGAWRSAHPDTLVLDRPRRSDPLGGRPPREGDGDRLVRDYGNDPYAFYRTNAFDTFGLKVEDRRLGNKTVVIGVQLEGGAAKAYPRAAAVAAGLIQDTLKDVPLAVVYDAVADRVTVWRRPAGATLRLEDGALTDGSRRWDLEGRPLSAGTPALEAVWHLPVFWFAWAAFHPDTEVFAVETE